MIKKIIKLTLIIIWMGVIFSFSNDNAEESTKKSDKVIVTIYKTFHDKELTEKEKEKLIDKVVYPTRKLAHFTEYLILGLLIINFVSEFYAITTKSIIMAIILCFLYSISDELHQLFSDGRAPKLFDVVIDTLGASTGIFIYSLLARKLFRRKLYE